MKSIFERELAIWNYLHLAIKNITKFTLYFAIFLKKILGKNEESIGAESWSGTLWLLFLSWIIKNQNSGFVRAQSSMIFLTVLEYSNEAWIFIFEKFCDTIDVLLTTPLTFSWQLDSN